MHDRGKGKFKYVISNDDFYIQLSDRKPKINIPISEAMPFALVQISSECLTRVSPEQAVKKLFTILEKIGEIVTTPKVSRVDLFADITTKIDISGLRQDDFITRAGSFVVYANRQGFTGLSGTEKASPLVNIGTSTDITK